MTVVNCEIKLFRKVIRTEINRKAIEHCFFFVRDTFSVLHESFIFIFSSVLPCVIKSHCIQNGTTHAFQVRKIE